MSERNLDFDKVIDRKGTGSLKFDFAARRGMPEDILPLWVADMDFQTSSYIQDAIIDQAEHGIYGYTETKEEYFAIVRDWMKREYDWETQERWLVKTPGIVYALAMAVKAFTGEGDAVMIQQPVYYPFSEVIRDNHRRIVDNALVLSDADSEKDAHGQAEHRADHTHSTLHYRIDFEDFEQKIISEKVKLFFLCNPHNPVGRAWTREELIKIGDICLKHGVIVVSDEIHADFTWTGRHLVFANLKPEYNDISVVCTSPTKTFNIAALQISNIFIPNRKLHRAFREQVDASGYSQCNGVGIRACEAAYTHGQQWLSGVRAYISENMDHTVRFIEERLPKLHAYVPEATYLMWIDFRELGLSNTQLEDLIVKKAGLWLDSGAIFGKAGEGFQRINVACPRATLNEALLRIERAVANM